MLKQLINFFFPAQCGGCGKIGTGICERCLPPGEPISFRAASLNVSALAAYERSVRRAVLALKSGRRDIAVSFAERLCALVSSTDVLVPVPTTAARRRDRGFDGCELIACKVANLTGATAVCGLRQTAGDRQRGRDRDARLAARARFAWRGDALSGLHVTLLDDVVTTGATLEDCANTLRLNGAIVERALVIAKA